MINIVTILSTAIRNGIRNIKYRRLGKSDIQTSFESMPFGFDSNPIKDVKAIYASTGVNGDTVILGYINTKQLTQIGENRLYSTNENGEVQIDLILKNNGTIELGGSVNSLVRYQSLDLALQSFKTEIQAELVKIATGISQGGGSYTPGTLNIDISDAEIDELKCS